MHSQQKSIKIYQYHNIINYTLENYLIAKNNIVFLSSKHIIDKSSEK